MKAQGKSYLSCRGDEGGGVRWYTNTETAYDDCGVVSATLYISDCYKTSVLEFSANTNKQLKKRVAKLDSLIEELNKFRSSLVSTEKKAIKFYY